MMGWFDNVAPYVPGTQANKQNNPYQNIPVVKETTGVIGSLPSWKDTGQSLGGDTGGQIGQGADYAMLPTGYLGSVRSVTDNLGNTIFRPKTPMPGMPDFNITDAENIAELEASRQKTLKDLQSQEAQMKGALLSQAGETGKAIDKQLSQLISQTGYFTGLANQTTAASMASRNMSRSGMAGNALASNALRGQQAIGSARSTADQQKRAVEQQTIDAQQQVADKRKEISNRLTDLEIQGLKSTRYQEEATTLQSQFKEFINNLKMSTQAKQDLYAMYGSLGTVAGLGLGYGMTGQSSNNGSITTTNALAPSSNTGAYQSDVNKQYMV